MMPQPNLPSGAPSCSCPNPITGDGFVGKFGFVVTQKDRVSFRWFWDYRRGISPFPASPKQSIPDYSPAPNSQDPKTATVNYVRTWNLSLISTSRVSFTKWVYGEGDSVNTSLADLGATNTVNGRFSATAPTIDQRI